MHRRRHQAPARVRQGRDHFGRIRPAATESHSPVKLSVADVLENRSCDREQHG